MTVSPSTVVRSDLVRLIEQELLGPRPKSGSDGLPDPHEEIKGTPRAAYALGALAPVTVDPNKVGALTADPDETDEGADPVETGRGVTEIDPATAGQRGVPTLTDEDAGSADEDEESDEGPRGSLTYPSSMGLRFQVPRDCGVLAVTASWGRYESFRRENEDGRRFQWSRRTPVEKTTELDVRGHEIHVLLDPIPLDDDVSLRVELFPRDDRVIVELALSNDRVTGLEAPPAIGCSRPRCTSRLSVEMPSSCPLATCSTRTTTRSTTSAVVSTCSIVTGSSSPSVERVR